MKQILSTVNGNRTYEVAMPTPGDKEVLVQVYASVISTGTETMEMKKETKTLFENLQEKKALWDKINKLIKEKGFGSTLKAIKTKLSPADQSILLSPVGYSNAGVIIAKGRLVTEFNPGDRVACAGAGIASHAEFTAVPVNLTVKVPDDVKFESAGFTTIGAIAMQGLRRTNVTFGETIVISGLGLLGLLAVQIAKAWGLVVIGTDINLNRLELAKELGADYCFDANDINLVQKIKDLTYGNGSDAVIIYAATKRSEPANLGFEMCRKKGRVVIVGSVGMDLQRDAMYMKELDFVMSTSYGPGRYDNQYELKGVDYPIGYVRWTENRNMMEFVRLLSIGHVKVDKLISNSFNIDQVQEAYTSLLENPGEAISAVFVYPHEEKSIPVSRLEINTRTKHSGKIGVGIIGAGSFIQRNHLANILNMPDEFELIAIAEKKPVSAKSASEKYKVNYVTTDYFQILNDPDIDLVIIGTRHNLHAEMVADSIKSSKNVLVEKPLAMNHDEMLMVENAFYENPDVIVTVGFNRRYSPLIQKAKSLISKNGTPIVVNYRVNAGDMSPEFWPQDLEEGGGRIIGEACHFIDLISYLTSGSVKSLNAIHVPTDGKTIKSEDNVIITLAFDNGSIGVLTYTSIGGKDMEKERIEIFTNESSIVINDFVDFQTFNSVEKGYKLKTVDKGHKALIAELAKKLRNKESLISPFKTDIAITNLTLSALEQIHRLKISENQDNSFPVDNY
ncbi:MAG: bi-domain-containing oxidoreductase [Bacteroidales bacterium]|nr:bi-domain-containing oxidoreductase [Bacteroidales bacterium]